MIIEYKDAGVFESCVRVRWHPTLIEIVSWMGDHEIEIIITEGWRELAKWKPSDVHCTDPLRAFDIRSWVFLDPESVAELINRAWAYDTQRPEKKVALYHNAGSGFHFHIQCHPNTRRRI